MSFAVDVVTCVQEAWPHWLSPQGGLVARAFAEGIAELRLTCLRSFGQGPHRKIDDTPFGGGAGMVLAAPPLRQAIAAARARTPGPVVLLSPRGQPFTQQHAAQLSQAPGMVLVCGRYEGFDERVYAEADMCLSLGDFVLSGGDPAALCIIDAVVRLLPGTLGNSCSLAQESFSSGLLEYPQYTRPIDCGADGGGAVPEVLRGGNHAAIAAWRQKQAEQLTALHRPDLWAAYQQRKNQR